jgi:hypothetical protein
MGTSARDTAKDLTSAKTMTRASTKLSIITTNYDYSLNLSESNLEVHLKQELEVHLDLRLGPYKILAI